jgi:hypothetical protein
LLIRERGKLYSRAASPADIDRFLSFSHWRRGHPELSVFTRNRRLGRAGIELRVNTPLP